MPVKLFPNGVFLFLFFSFKTIVLYTCSSFLLASEIHDVYKYLKTASDKEQIDWNFAKYLVNRDGLCT